MAKGIAAKRSGTMLWVLKHLLTSCAMGLNPMQRGVQIVDMKVEMYGRPMTLELTPIGGLG